MDIPNCFKSFITWSVFLYKIPIPFLAFQLIMVSSLSSINILFGPAKSAFCLACLNIILVQRNTELENCKKGNGTQNDAEILKAKMCKSNAKCMYDYNDYKCKNKIYEWK